MDYIFVAISDNKKPILNLIHSKLLLAIKINLFFYDHKLYKLLNKNYINYINYININYEYNS